MQFSIPKPYVGSTNRANQIYDFAPPSAPVYNQSGYEFRFFTTTCSLNKGCSISWCESSDRFVFSGVYVHGLLDYDGDEGHRVRGKSAARVTVLNIPIGFDFEVDKRLGN